MKVRKLTALLTALAMMCSVLGMLPITASAEAPVAEGAQLLKNGLFADGQFGKDNQLYYYDDSEAVIGTPVDGDISLW